MTAQPPPASYPPPPPPLASYTPPPPPPAGSYVPAPAAAFAPPGPLATAGPHIRAFVAGLDQETLRPTVIVTGVIFGIWLIAQLLGAIAPAAAQTGGAQGGGGGHTSGYYTIGQLRFGLVSGWNEGNAQAANANARLTNGVAYVDIYVYNFSGSPTDLYNQYDANLQKVSTRFNASAAAPVLPNGLSAVRGTYFGVFNQGGAVDGEVTAVTLAGTGYVFDAWATSGMLNQSLPDIELMLSTLQQNP